jgi:hypothetical protein
MLRFKAGLVGAACILTSILLCGCKLSLGASGTRAWSSPPTNHVGATVQGTLAFPQEYRYLAGYEISLLSDEWRAGVVSGYSALPTPDDIFGWEVLGRVQLKRGFQRTFATTDLVFGTSVGFPFQTIRRDPWEVDELAGLRWYIVPSVGVNGVVGDQHIHPEITVNLSVRFELGLGVLP